VSINGAADIPYVTRPMKLDDIDEVIVIERASFPSPWPASAFRYDLLRTDYAYYLVVVPRQAPAAVRREPAPAASSLWQRLWRREPAAPPAGIVGYVGFWLLVDEAHICNIAVAPQWRGRGLGELLLLRAIQAAGERGMAVATLEVRVGNTVAQNLYRKFGFEVVGQRKHYYSDNGEDALIMTTGLLNSPTYQHTLRSLERELTARLRAEPAPQML